MSTRESRGIRSGAIKYCRTGHYIGTHRIPIRRLNRRCAPFAVRTFANFQTLAAGGESHTGRSRKDGLLEIRRCCERDIHRENAGKCICSVRMFRRDISSGCTLLHFGRDDCLREILTIAFRISVPMFYMINTNVW